MRRPSRRAGTDGRDLLGPAGWIFADVLLALAVVFLATQPGEALPSPDGPTTTGSTSTTTASTTTTTVGTTTTTRPPGVDSRFVCFRVQADAALLTGPASPARDAHLAALEQQVADRLAQPDLKGRRAGIVLSFGVADQPATGRARAEAFNRDVLPRLPAAFQRPGGGSVANRAFWDGQAEPGAPDGSIAVNIYPIVDADHGPLDQEHESAC